jgi:hypothetical protein
MSNTNAKRFTQEQLSDILDLHGKWLRNEPGGVRASLRNTNLRNADLTGAKLQEADLLGADLPGANLRNASLTVADLTGAKLPSPVIDLTGCKVGYKKVWNRDYTKGVVIELRFPEGAKLVSTVLGRKCRASEATVVRCLTPDFETETEFRSLHDEDFTYRVGETVKPSNPFDDSITEECTSGIHFFTTREEAEKYQ